MKRIIFSLLVCLLISSCVRTPEQASRRINKLLDRFPTAIDTTTVTVTKVDTVFVHDTILIEKTDTQGISRTYNTSDSIVDLLKLKGCDTVFIEVVKEKLRNNCTIQNLLRTPVLIDTLGISGKIYAKNNTIIVDLVRTISEIKEETKTTNSIIVKCPEMPFWKDIWFWAFCGVTLVLVLVLMRR